MKTAMETADKDFIKEMEKPVQTTIQSKANVRGEILMEAGKLITGDRQDEYGSFRDQMEAIAEMFNGLQTGVVDAPKIEAKHVAQILMLLKLRRTVTSTSNDSYVDLCGYGALTAEHFNK
jgi:hypothetical protein